MRWKTKVRDLPGRIAVGAFILNSGLDKRDADAARQLHGFASGTYPFLGKIDAKTFAKSLSASEIALGTTLLVPVVPTVVAGACLTVFACGLVGLYLRTPGMRQSGSLRPTEQGVPLAKDFWLLGVGLGYVLDGLTSDHEEARSTFNTRRRRRALCRAAMRFMA
ncbi:hypothetical protein [Amycolatopsis taiwanensis]|uniref:Uncharacterized protein n=1 Tax=Amycolatopsis taiwanensis TaxID=342230 RepID=A0A9W6VGW3_9PSEU|nr:hypothetical protein [Amycolatopsis taiwanensis]GLY65916.1 hypothetical protein Atai01_25350 [Amycolatopsis taiwanensis]